MIEEIGFFARIALGTVFALAAVAKIRAPAPFIETTQEVMSFLVSRPVTRGASNTAAFLFIVCESFTAVLLLSGLYPALGAIAALILLLFFSGISGLALRRSLLIDCNCFGSRASVIGGRTLVRALLLTVPAGAYLLTAIGARGIEWPIATVEAWVSSGALVAGSLVLLHWIVNVDVPLGLAKARKARNTGGERTHNT